MEKLRNFFSARRIIIFQGEEVEKLRKDFPQQSIDYQFKKSCRKQVAYSQDDMFTHRLHTI